MKYDSLDNTEKKENSNLSNNFLNIDSTKIPWVNIVGIMKTERKKDNNFEILIKFIHSNGTVTSGDENLSAYVSEERYHKIINSWNEWIERHQKLAVQSGKSFFQAEQKIFDEKISSILKDVSFQTSESILENNKALKDQLETLKEQNKLLNEIILENKKSFQKTIEGFNHFLTDLSSVESVYEQIKDDILIDDTVNSGKDG